MRCLACNTTLTDFESSRKYITSEEFVDLCNQCYKHIKDDVQAIDNQELINLQDVIDFEDDLW